MIDLSYKNPDKKDENDFNVPLIFQFWIFVNFSAFLAFIVLSGIAGDPLF